MENNQSNCKTAFDSALEQHNLEIIKAAIPYLNTTEQTFISVYVKFFELVGTITMVNNKKGMGICSMEAKQGSLLDMLTDIKSVCTKKECETIDMILNLFSAFELYETYKETFTGESSDGNGNSEAFSFNALKSMLSPEQQQMLDAYSMMFN